PVIRARMTAKLIFDSCEKRVSVGLERPVKASATTGSTPTPQPDRVHGPVVRPTTLVTAPATPAGRAALNPGSQAAPWLRRKDHRAKRAPKTREVSTMRHSVGTSRTKPPSIPSPPLSALAQPRAMLDRKESFLSRGSDEPRYSGSRRSQGLKVTKSTGRRAM